MYPLGHELDVLANLCLQKGISFEPSDLRWIISLARKLDVQREEMVSMIVLEILSEKESPSKLSTLISRVRKRIARAYEKNRRKYEKPVADPKFTQDDLIDLKNNLRKLSVAVGSIIEASLDGKSVKEISEETGIHPRTVYRRLSNGIRLLQTKGTHYMGPGELNRNDIVDYQESGFKVLAHPPVSSTENAGNYFAFALSGEDTLEIGNIIYPIRQCSFQITPRPAVK